MILVMKLNSFTGIGRGEKASLTTLTGATYEDITPKTNLTPTQISRVSIPKTLEDARLRQASEVPEHRSTM